MGRTLDLSDYEEKSVSDSDESQLHRFLCLTPELCCHTWGLTRACAVCVPGPPLHPCPVAQAISHTHIISGFSDHFQCKWKLPGRAWIWHPKRLPRRPGDSPWKCGGVASRGKLGLTAKRKWREPGRESFVSLYLPLTALRLPTCQGPEALQPSSQAITTALLPVPTCPSPPVRLPWMGTARIHPQHLKPLLRDLYFRKPG